MVLAPRAAGPHETIPFRIGQNLSAKVWLTVLDTASAEDPFAQMPLTSETYPLQGDRWCCCRKPVGNENRHLDVPGRQPAGRHAAVLTAANPKAVRQAK